MDRTTMDSWVEPTLAWITIVIVGLTAVANFLDWAVPRLRDLAWRRGPGPGRGLTALARFAEILTKVLETIRSVAPRLTVGAPPAYPPTDRPTDVPPVDVVDDGTPTLVPAEHPRRVDLDTDPGPSDPAPSEPSAPTPPAPSEPPGG